MRSSLLIQRSLISILCLLNSIPGIEVVILDPHADGVSQMANHLADRSGIDAIHIISHGSQGQLNLGNSALTLDSMASHHAEALSAINGSLSDGADILIYGCNFGEGAIGQQAALQLAMLTGADVAASDDLTGHEVEGGDWELEVETGAIEADIFLAASSEKSWTGSLDVTSNLVGHWTFDEGSGASAADSSANSNTGTLADGAGWDTGVVGSGSLDVSGNFDRVEVANDLSLDLGSGDFSISFWVNSSHSGSQGRIIGDGDGVNDGVIIYADSIGQISAEVRSGGSFTSVNYGGVLDGSWHHVVFRRLGNSFDLFVDGSSAIGNGMALGSIDNSNTLMIGASSAASNDFDGLLDDIRIYDRALAGGDITELYNMANSDPTGSPAITGTAQEGQTLTADTSGISDADGLGAFSYQWQSGWVDIPGATSSTYLLDDADVGNHISVIVSYTDGGGTLESLSTGQTGSVMGVNDAPTGQPVITGTVETGETLTADTSGIADEDGLGAFSYQWLRDGSDISGATGSTYDLVLADNGTQISVRVSYTDGQGTSESVTSAQTAAVSHSQQRANRVACGSWHSSGRFYRYR